MKQGRKFKLVGERVIKTGVAVFVTAFICQMLQLSIVYAVITAIVTIEPTASDSIKKGIIRFPASVIGASYALFFTFWLGHGAISYTLAATLTIFTCNKLKLEAGTLVATLTAVAMIPTIHDEFFLSFVERLGTTTIALIVSTLVNILILPPKFSAMISKSINELASNTAQLLDDLSEALFSANPKSSKELTPLYTKLMKEVDKAFQLCQYEQKEMRFHRLTFHEMRILLLEQKKLHLLQKLLFHIGNLLQVRSHTVSINHEMMTNLRRIANKMAAILNNRQEYDEEYNQLVEAVNDELWKDQKERKQFSAETSILFEMLSIHHVLEELQLVIKRERKLKRDHNVVNELNRNASFN